MSDVEYPNSTIRLENDGGRVLAWLGVDPQVGLMTTAADVPEALMAMAFRAKRMGWLFPDVEPPMVPPRLPAGVLVYPSRDTWHARLFTPGSWWEFSHSHLAWRAVAHLALLLVERDVVVTIPTGRGAA